MNTTKRVLPFSAGTLFAAADVPAQDWAKAHLEQSPRHLEWVKVKQAKREVSSFLAFPEVKDKSTAVVVIHEIFGLTDWVRGVTDQLAWMISVASRALRAANATVAQGGSPDRSSGVVSGAK